LHLGSGPGEDCEAYCRSGYHDDLRIADMQ
jgi:hypothetical protein